MTREEEVAYLMSKKETSGNRLFREYGLMPSQTHQSKRAMDKASLSSALDYLTENGKLEITTL